MRWHIAGALAAAAFFLAPSLAGCSLGASSFHTGECVQVGVDSSGNGTIDQVSCGDPGDLYKIVQVVSGSTGTCTVGDQTFQDQVSNQTYCLEEIYVISAGNNSADGSDGTDSTPTQSALAGTSPSSFPITYPEDMTIACAQQFGQGSYAQLANENPPSYDIVCVRDGTAYSGLDLDAFCPWLAQQDHYSSSAPAPGWWSGNPERYDSNTSDKPWLDWHCYNNELVAHQNLST